MTAAFDRFLLWWHRLTGTGAGRALVVTLTLAALALPAAHPSMFGALPQSADGLLHLYRLIGLDHAMRLGGGLWPRYLPGMAFGYGIPLFNFYPLLAYYPILLLNRLGLSFLDAFLIGSILYTLFGGLGMYLLGQAWGGPRAGIIAAAAYLYAPYVLLVWPRRGAIPEQLALGLLAWALWAFWRLSRRGRRLDMVLAVCCFAALLLTHNITGLVGAAILAACCVLLWWTSPDPPRAFVRLLAAGVLALGLAAFCWLPALVEKDYTRIGHNPAYAGVLDYRQHFATLSEIFAWPSATDLTHLNPSYPASLGWPAALLALAAIPLILHLRRRDREASRPPVHWLAFAGPLLAALLFMVTDGSRLIWDVMPLLEFLQFPWRLIGPASILLAVLAGIGAALAADRIRSEALQGVWLGGLVLLIIAFSLPWLYGVYLPQPQASTIVDAQNFERETGHIGGLTFGEYLPVWVGQMPDPDRLTGLYARSEVIPRLQPNPEVRLAAAEWGALDAQLDLNALGDTTLVFDWLYFPGWWAVVDGSPVEIHPTDPTGLISLDVPAGEHTVKLGFGPTPLRRAAGAISAASVVLLAIGLAAPLTIWRPAGRSSVEWGGVGPALAAVALAGVLAFTLKALWIDNADTIFKRARFANGVEGGLQTPVMAALGGQIRLMGYDLPDARLRPGRPITLALYWELAGGLIEDDYSSMVLIRDSAGNIVQQVFSFYPGGAPTSTWVPGFYVRELVELDVPPGTPPGTYTLWAALYSREAGRNLDVVDAAGSPLGVLAPLGTIEVLPPRRPPARRDLALDNPLDYRLLAELSLIAASAPPREAVVGQEFPMIWYWRAERTPGADFTAHLLWVDAEDRVAARSYPVSPTRDFPTSQWRRRDVWRGIHMLHVPGSLTEGDYTVMVQMIDPAGAPLGNRAPIGEMHVTVPPRTYDLPEMDYAAGVPWENGVWLAGYDMPTQEVAPGDGLRLTFYWRPDAEVNTGLTLFIHVVDQSGRIVAQRDQVPANGSRPTTGWAPGEVIEDPYALYIAPDVPPGQHLVRIGWYDPRTGQRVKMPDGGEFWQLPQQVRVIEP
ncbi:MAG: hypothetical protein Kow00124_10670 [Anaerolineae bacterium]